MFFPNCHYLLILTLHQVNPICSSLQDSLYCLLFIKYFLIISYCVCWLTIRHFYYFKPFFYWLYQFWVYILYFLYLWLWWHYLREICWFSLNPLQVFSSLFSLGLLSRSCLVFCLEKLSLGFLPLYSDHKYQ